MYVGSITKTENEACLRIQGEKEKNIADIHDFSIVLPTMEYHNQIWTWFDLLMAIRGDTKRVILAQVILTTPYTHRENTPHLQWYCFCLLHITHSQIHKFTKLHLSLSSIFQKHYENQLNQVSFQYSFIYQYYYLINGNEFQTLILEV